MVRLPSLLCLHGLRRLLVVERAVWCVVSIYSVSIVLCGIVWLDEQGGPLFLSTMSA